MPKKPSTIDLVPDDIRHKLQELLRDPRVTQMEAAKRINAILEGKGLPERVSKSSVNRYAQRMEEMGKRIRESREIAEMWVGQLGATPQGQVGNFVNETLRTLALDISLIIQDGKLNGKNAPKAAKMLNNLALAMQRLEKAANLNVEREKEIRQQALDDVAKKVDAATGAGEAMTAERFREILRESYGV